MSSSYVGDIVSALDFGDKDKATPRIPMDLSSKISRAKDSPILYLTTHEEIMSRIWTAIGDRSQSDPIQYTCHSEKACAVRVP